MPTMTNPETGETKEISEEEFSEILRSGKGSLQQDIKVGLSCRKITSWFSEDFESWLHPCLAISDRN